MTLFRHPLRLALIVVAAVIVLGVGAVAVMIARFDPTTYKPELVAAVKQATGRDLTFTGKIGLKLSLRPTIQVADVAFSNPPGFSRPQMATVRGIELQLNLLPLLSSRIEIDRLVLIHPDILLETDAAGSPNWQMTKAPSPAVPPGSSAPPGSSVQTQGGKSATTISIDAISIQDGTIAYRDPATGKVTALVIAKLQANAASPDSPLQVDADASFKGTAFTLTAETGSLDRLQDPVATSPWPVKLALTVAGAKLSAQGTLTQPLRGKGYDLTVNGTIPNAAALAPLLQGYAPPPLHDVSFAATIADHGGKLPDVSTLTLHVGASDLGTLMPGLTLDKLDIAAPKADQPMKAEAGAKLGGTALTLAGTFGSPAQLLPNAKPAPFPVDVSVQAASATASATAQAKGSIADASAMTGANLAMTVQIPDLAALSPLARRPLPALKAVAFHGTLTDAKGGFKQGASLLGLSLTSPVGDLSGNAAVDLGTRTSLTAALKSSHIDLDALLAAIPPTRDAAALPSVSAQNANTPAPPKQADGRLFPDQPIPFGLLRSDDADLKLDVASLRAGGADYKAIATHAVLKDGKLVVENFAADLPGGPVSGSLFADVTRPVPSVHIVLHSPGLALKTLLAATHQPAYGTGNLEIYADLGGVGVSPHAIASSLDGSFGVAMAGGTIDNHLFGRLLGKVMQPLNALDLANRGGTSDVKCFGLRMNAQHGIGAIEGLGLSSSLLTMTGSGAVNLGQETMAMQLHPRARVSGKGVVIPLDVSGPIRDPAVKVNQLAAAESNIGVIAGAIMGNAAPSGIVPGLPGGDKLMGDGTSDICPATLAIARGQKPPAAQVTPAAPASKPAVPDVGNILKNLFR